MRNFLDANQRGVGAGRVHGSGTPSGGMPAGGDALRAGGVIDDVLLSELDDLRGDAHGFDVVH